MDEALLDTDILSEFLKQRNTSVAAMALTYLRQHRQLTFSSFSRFEIRRGYLAKKASRQLGRFDVFCAHSNVLPVTDAIFDKASELWSLALQGGHPHADADLLIAATALQHDLMLASGNRRHFDWIPSLRLEDWRAP